MEISEEVQAVILFVVAVWGAAASTLNFGKEANRLRDEIIVGVVDGEEITLEHRRLKLRNDWLPTKSAGALLCLFYSVALAAPSLILNLEGLTAYALQFAAFGPLVGFGFFLLGISDYLFIKRQLQSASPFVET